MDVIEPGRQAPDFTLRDQNKQEHSLADYRGRPVVLLFYPQDFSSVCTEEMSCMMENLSRFDELEAQVFGISIDHVDAHRVFAAQQGVTYPLLADFHPKGEVSRAYGLYRDDLGFASRGYVVIGPEGEVVAAKNTGLGTIPDMDEIADALSVARA